MYKKSSEYFYTDVAKKVSGLPQTNRLMQQRRKANPRAPIVPMTRTCVYCGSSPAGRKEVKQLRTKIRKMTVALNSLREEKKQFDNTYTKLAARHLKLLALVNELPPRFRPSPPKGSRSRRRKKKN